MQFSPEDTGAIGHLYAAEVGRMVAYRIRLDTTTNWAVVTSAALITFTLGNGQAPHYVLLMNMFLSLVFLSMEANRYRFFDLVRRRVRLLEAGFYVDILGGQPVAWQSELRQSLLEPRPTISLRQAVGLRLRNNYLGLLVAVLAAWLLKLSLVGGLWPQVAQVGVVSGGIILGLVGLVFALLTFLAVFQSVSEDD